MLGHPEDSLIYCMCQPTLRVHNKNLTCLGTSHSHFLMSVLSVAVVLHKNTS